MRVLLIAGLLVAFAAPAFAGEGGCSWGDKVRSVKAPSPDTVVEAPQTPIPDGTKG